MTILTLKFNNYFNRIVKIGDLDTYAPFIVNRIDNVNFNPADGVTTTQIINSSEENIGDYLVLLDDTTIVSRWFIIDSTRLRNGQYELQLRRDLFVDAYNDVIQAPMFIEKATLDPDNPLIFNSENMSYNQIKKSETLLKDGTECAWIVGYMARNDGEGNITHISGTVTAMNNQYISLTTMTKTQFINDIIGQTLSDSRIELTCSFNQENYPYDIKTILYYENIGQGYVAPEKDRHNVWACSKLPDLTSYNPIDYARLRSNISSAMNLKTNVTNSLFYNGKNVKLSDGKIYNVEIKLSNDSEYIVKDIPSTMPNVFEDLNSNFKNWLDSTGSVNNTIYGNPYGSIAYKVKSVSAVLTEVMQDGTYSFDIPISRNKVKDAPYDMFAIPYSPDKNNEPYVWIAENDMGAEGAHLNSEISLLVAQNISEKWGATLYDLQLLPYCPLPELLSDPGTSDMSIVNLRNGFDYTLIKDSDNKIMSMIVFPNNSSFSTKIELQNPIKISDVKVESECDMYRLCSPNYQGVFEFNAAKNNGISYFDVDCTYLPYNPYIHIAPNFGGLYGKDFDDTRGLICSGDFSLARISDAWTNYQLQNKNYMASFNRQIQNMEVQNNVARVNDILGASVGTLAGAVGGTKIGGGAVGGVIGGVTAAGAGIADVIINEKLRAENMDYTKDMFGYQLGNIKAVPDSLSKTTAYTKNNKYFPFLEYYTCTEEEKNALKNKLKYNGMTVMAIGTISEYLKPEESYIKGRLIRLVGDYDNHYINELSQELYKGVYI